MTIQTRLIDYDDQGTALQGYLAFDTAHSGPRPAVLIAHQWDGRSSFVEERARKLAGAGYAAFALDMYGKGVLGKSTEENLKFMTPFMEDRARLARRMNLAAETARAQPEVDGDRMAVIGYCFGGLCALDLARSCAKLAGAVSFHGLLKPNGLPAGKIAAKVLVLHGAEDPMVSQDDLVAFEKEMTTAGADWQIHVYGGARHAFAVPGANNAELGIQHQPAAERRSWQAMGNFLAELFQ